MKKLAKRPLSVAEILRWADAHREATGKWPTKDSGPIIGRLFETWGRVDKALRDGLRGLDGGSSLALFLAEHRGARTLAILPSLTEEIILGWCDAHFQATGQWPTAKSGWITGTDEKWANVNQAMLKGLRSLPAGSSLARLLAKHRGIRNRKALPKLTEDVILAWCDAHHARTGSWPMSSSGPILHAPGETWMAVEMALNKGRRGFTGGKTLAWLLAEKRGLGDYYGKPPLTEALILDWADNHFLRTPKLRERPGRRSTRRWPRPPGGFAAGRRWPGCCTSIEENGFSKEGRN